MTDEKLTKLLEEAGDLLAGAEPGALSLVGVALPSRGSGFHMIHNFPIENFEALADILMAKAQDLHMELVLVRATPTHIGH